MSLKSRIPEIFRIRITPGNQLRSISISFLYNTCHSYLEVSVLVERTPGEAGQLAEGGCVDVGTVEEEEFHSAAGGHTFLGYLVVNFSLWT